MDYERFASILNRHIFGESKKALLEKLATEPHRFIGLFRPSKPKTKVIQYLLQSREIRFGDAIEEAIEQLLVDLGFTALEKRIQSDSDSFSLDLHFRDEQRVYFVEQKVRDDHDSTKKRGQMRNFAEKLELLVRQHQESLVGIMYFVDPSMTKNKNYYDAELERLRLQTGSELHLFYGSELFDFLGHPEVWQQMTEWLERWQQSLSDFPEVNFDLEPELSFEEIKDIPPRHLSSLLSNPDLWESGVMRVVFPHGSTLRLLMRNFETQRGSVRRQLAGVLRELLRTRY